MTTRKAAIALLWLAPAALLWWAGERMDRAERTVRVDLSCHGDRCEARIDGGEPLVHDIPAGKRARSLGLYAYNAWEAEESVRFRNLHVDRILGMRPYDLTLTELDHAGWFKNDPDDTWKIKEGNGLAFDGPPGSRGIAVLAAPTDNDFDLSVELDHPVDSGIAFRGYDKENTWLFIVRSTHNDAFFCRMHRGEFLDIAAIMPLRELTAGREALRLAGLAGQIATLSCLALLALAGLCAVARRTRSKTPSPRTAWSEDRVRLVALLLFVATVVICGSISTVWLHGMPHIEDESAYLLQARIFASGDLWAGTPRHPQFFEHAHMIVQGERWFSKYPPLFSAVLALGVLAGTPWLVNPFLAALTGWLVYRLGRELAGPVWGLIAWALLLTSPFFVVMGANFMSHMLSALLAAGFLLCGIRAVRTDSPGLWFAAGLCLSLGLMTRPFTAALMGLAVAPFMAIYWIRRLKAPAMLALGVLPGIAAFFLWGALHSEPGKLSVNPYAMNEASDTLGFGPDKGATWLRTFGSFGHTPAKSLRAAHNYLDYTSHHQFGWPLRLSFVFALAGLYWHRRRGEAWMLALIPVALALGHGFYWATQHLLYGARYWFAAVPAFVLLTILGLRAMTRRREAQPIVAAAVAVFVAVNLWAYLPKRLRELPRYGGVGSGLVSEVERAGIERGIVFVRTPSLRFNDGFHLNDPSDPDATLFAVDRGDANDALLDEYHDREAWQWDGKRLVPLNARAGALP